MEFRLLGSLEVAELDWQAKISGQKRKAVLAALVLHNGSIVSADRLADLVWNERPPASAAGTLHSHVHHLRKQLGPAAELLVSDPPGYLLRAEPEQIDVVRFGRLAAEGRAALQAEDFERAAEVLDRALGLWRARALLDLTGVDFAEREADRLEEQRLAVLEDRLTADVALGRHQLAVAELETMVAAYPLRERLAELLVLALYRSGRQGDALRAFQRTREALVGELGIEPGRALRNLEEAVLRQDPALDGPVRPLVVPDPGASGAHPGAPATSPSPTGPAPLPASSGPAPAEPTGDRVRSADEPSATDAVRSGPHGLPIPRTTFIGRGAELGQLLQLLRTSRLVTITGSGGSGKTRLAAELAKRWAGDEHAAAWFVDLAVVEDPAMVAGAVATTLRLGDRGTTADALCAALGSERLLVVLDNCEQVIETVAVLVDELLGQCAELVVLATSREELQIAGEAVWRTPSLSCPPGPAAILRPDDVLGAEAAQLFLERLGAGARPPSEPAPDELAAVATICRKLDGIPLALELAAGLASTMSLDDAAHRLVDHFRIRDLRRRGAVVRHRTLDAAIGWSYDLLDADERDVFLRLSVFVGPFTLEAAEAVAAVPGRDRSVSDCLGSLVRKSIVNMVEGGATAGRYRLLETLRQYAADALDDDAAAEARRRHSAWFLTVAERAEARFNSPDAARGVDAIEADLPNLRAALQWSLDEGQLEVGLRLAGTLRWFFGRMGELTDLRGQLERVLDRRASLEPRLQLLAITALGTAEFARGDSRTAGKLGEEGIALARAEGDEHQLEIALLLRGASAVYEANDERAVRCFEEAIDLGRRQGDRWALAWILASWSVSSRRAGRSELAERQLVESLAIFQALGDRHGQALSLVNLATLAHSRGDLDEAARLCDEVMDLGRSLGDMQTMHFAMSISGRIEIDRQDHRLARTRLVQSVQGYAGAEHVHTVAIALEGVAILARLAGDAASAATIWGACDRLRDEFHVRRSAARRAERDDHLALAARTLGWDGVDAALVRGSSLDLDQAVALGIATATALDLDHLPTATTVPDRSR